EDGKVMIGANNSETADKVVDAINSIIKDVETGDVYNAKVVKLMNFGAFAEILPGKQGLIHISEISTERVENVESVLSVGDNVDVKVIKVDKQGRIDLSIKALLGDSSNDVDEINDDKDFKKSRRSGKRKQVGG
ncbi:MAG: S1 RNA-binding domain-containing protein, partial [SAR202 cluster bacterium]|nr:S1 RNA-binding domain-containing protein [SAR202 cluster bacterium]